MIEVILGWQEGGPGVRGSVAELIVRAVVRAYLLGVSSVCEIERLFDGRIIVKLGNSRECCV